MKNNGLSDSSINFTRKALAYLGKHADLNKPEQIKHYIATLKCGNGYKHNLALAYDKYCQYNKIAWQPPTYKRQARAIRIPTKTQIEMLIASAGRVNTIKLSISKETGLRPIELCNLKVRDVDIEQRTIYPATAKNGAPRKLRISNSLNKTLQKHIIKFNLKADDKIFRGNSANYSKHFRLHRNQLADKLNKPELRTIRLYDFRHYFATMLYHKTKDILLVKQQMGHRKLETTLIYTQLLDLNDDEWTCRTANIVKQATALIEAGFQYVTELDGMKLFRKRK